MIKEIAILIFFQLFATGIFAQPVIKTTTFKTINGENYTINQISNRLTALVFLAPDCPLSQQYTLVLKALQKKYDQTLTIAGVFSGKNYNDSIYKDFKKTYGISFVLLSDENFVLADQLKALVTPEVFLLDSGLQLLYHGAIDNRVTELGKNRIKATENFLENAIHSYKMNEPAVITYVKPIGCFIEKHE